MARRTGRSGRKSRTGSRGWGHVRLVVGGDWNVEPDVWAWGGASALGHVLHPGATTCTLGKGSTIVYFVVSREAREAVKRWGVEAAGKQATHLASTLLLDVDPRAYTAGIWAPRPIPDRIVGCARLPGMQPMAPFPTAEDMHHGLDAMVHLWSLAAEDACLEQADVPYEDWGGRIQG